MVGRSTPLPPPRTPVEEEEQIGSTSSHRLLQLSQELKAEAMSIAHRFSQDLTKRFDCTHSREDGQRQQPSAGIDAARTACRRRVARPHALWRAKGVAWPPFISSNNAWMEVQANFDHLNYDGFISSIGLGRAVRNLCVGGISPSVSEEEPEDILSPLDRVKEAPTDIFDISSI
ncbi:uncharacterized protein LOC133914287 [Phragmites australis]|uniref:uncharacterized protein LOC133914287 n=1 Tax=Phragmites australis TaxID=29695 RepID=UPI002D773048|nr:uncharacterized protein LOC133914287 [Phragmites australis]